MMMRKSAIIAIFAAALVGASLVSANAEDDLMAKMFQSVIKKPAYKTSLADAMANAKVDGKWKKMILSGNVTADMPVDAKIGGKTYEIHKICFPRLCDQYAAKVAFGKGGKSAAVYFGGSSESHSFAGSPSAALKSYLKGS